MALLSQFKDVVKSLVPGPLMRTYRANRMSERERPFAGKTLQQTFSHIYSERLWGETSGRDFYSGPGSHFEAIVGPYVSAVRAFAGTLPDKLDAVDLGCGDFNVGRQLRDVFGSYTACDIVPELIAENRSRHPHVDFRVVNIASDPLPAGDVVLIRQVLQHLCNADIGAAVQKIAAYRYAIITEHIPSRDGFRPNLDKPSGADIRLSLQSGVVLTEPPFALDPLSQQVLCEVPAFGGLIRTIAYTLR